MSDEKTSGIDSNGMPTIPPFVASKAPYVIAVVIMALLAVITVLGITYMRPDKDNTILLTLALGFLATVTTGLMSYLKADETHLSVNSRVDAWMKSAEALAYQKGKDASNKKP